VLDTNELGFTATIYLPPRPGGPTATYEVVKISQNDYPAELRFIETDEPT
jgi:hypothetical protein